MDTSKQTWYILHIDDDEDDHVLVKSMLKEAKGRKVTLDWASTIDDGRKKLHAGNYQAVLVDYDMGPASGIDLIRECTARGIETPLILLTGRGNYEVDMEAMHAGASLYLTKGEINPLLLERSIRYAIERKQGEAQLRLSEEKFSIIFERSPTPTFLLSYPQARFIDVNQAYLDLTGFDKEDVVGKNSEELGITSPYDEMRHIIDTLEEQGQIQDVEIYVYTKNGQRCITSANMEVVVIEGEKMILGTAEDLTARKLVEAQLIDSNEALREANAHAEWVARFPEENPNPVLRVTVDGTLLYLNRSAIQLACFGNIGQRISNEILAFVTEAVVTECTLLREIDLGGKHYTVQVAPFPEESYANLYFIDSTERHQAEQQTRFQAMLLSRVHDAVVAIDEKMRVTYFNKAAEELFGWTLDEVHGKASEDLFGANLLGLTHEQVAQIFLDNGSYEGEVSFCRKDGSSFDAHVRSVVIHGSGKEVKGLVTSVRDITERKQAQDTLSRYAHQLEQSNKELENFALVASHDLREPLRKIENFGNLIAQRAGQALGETEREYLERMQNAAERMRVMIEDLLSLSRVTSAGKPFEIVDLNRVARTVLEDLERSIREAGGRVELGEMPVILADPTQMHQLLQNLVGNALKFCKPDEPPIVRVFSRNLPEGWVEICVADNGIGIDMRQAERLFQPFQRLHGRAEYEGTGIGLSVCRKIVKRHGGEIRVESQVGQGACFTVCLPGWS